MCSTPKLKPVKAKRTNANNIYQGMDQSSYSKMIKQASAAYEKKHPESLNQITPLRKNKKTKLLVSSKPLLYWLTQADMSELRRLMSQYISIN